VVEDEAEVLGGEGEVERDRRSTHKMALVQDF